MKVSILQFPGTNCEYDTQHAFEELGATTEIIWHKSATIPEDTDLLVVAVDSLTVTTFVVVQSLSFLQL